MNEDADVVQHEQMLEVEGRNVPLLLLLPPAAQWLYVFAHGAGAGMRHHFMNNVAARLAGHGVATLRYEYPYMAAGSRRPDRAPLLEAVSRAVVEWGSAELPKLRLAAGGKSMGGRMTSRAHADRPMPRVEGLIFFGFPLHAAGKPGTERADHLQQTSTPMLFLQGTRDSLAQLPLITDVCSRLGTQATLHVIDGGDHSFAVPRRSGRSAAQVLDELAVTTAHWLENL